MYLCSRLDLCHFSFVPISAWLLKEICIMPIKILVLYNVSDLATYGNTREGTVIKGLLVESIEILFIHIYIFSSGPTLNHVKVLYKCLDAYRIVGYIHSRASL